MNSELTNINAEFIDIINNIIKNDNRDIVGFCPKTGDPIFKSFKIAYPLIKGYSLFVERQPDGVFELYVLRNKDKNKDDALHRNVSSPSSFVESLIIEFEIGPIEATKMLEKIRDILDQFRTKKYFELVES